MIPIKKVKEIRESLGMTHLVLFARDKNNIFHVASHGETQMDANQSAQAANNLKKHLGWPEDLCNTKPLLRTCRNCNSYRPNNKECMLDEMAALPGETCTYFEPNC